MDLSSAIFSVDADGHVAGSVRTLDKIYEIMPLNGEVHAVWEIDPTVFPNEKAPLVAPIEDLPEVDVVPQSLQPRWAPASSLQRSTLQSQILTLLAFFSRQSNVVIDVLVAYTAQARIEAGSATAILAAINLAVTETNEAYAASGVTQRIRLVHAYQTSYTSAGFDADLNRITSTTDGQLDEIHVLRNQYGADLVSLWITDSSFWYVCCFSLFAINN
jgi:hypothetical protein